VIATEADTVPQPGRIEMMTTSSTGTATLSAPPTWVRFLLGLAFVREPPGAPAVEAIMFSVTGA